MTTQSRITRITQEMDQDPALADVLSQRILGQELTKAVQSMLGSNTETMTRQAQLGETVLGAAEAVAASVREMVNAAQQTHPGIGRPDDRAAFKELQAQETQERTQGQINALRGTVENAAGPGCEMKAAGNLRSLLGQRLGLRNARILKGPDREPDEEFTAALDRAQGNGLITEEELCAALLLDVIARANTTDRQTVYAAIEISITVNGGDVTRVRERARTIGTATGARAAAVVIGTAADERAQALMADGEVQLVTYPAG